MVLGVDNMKKRWWTAYQDKSAYHPAGIYLLKVNIETLE